VNARQRLRGERGSVSLLVVVMVPALLMAAGLVLDGGRQLQARREASAAAASAARAAAQMSDQEAYGPGLDPALAARRAQVHLTALGHVGTVDVTPAAVTVTVTATVDNLILPGSRTVSSASTSAPLDGVTTGQAPP
jgi:Flp pilus assembly protein TadG